MRRALDKLPVAALALVAAVLVPQEGAAQNRALGMGPRFSFVRGDTRQASPPDRYSGALVRARLSDRSVLELAIDYRSHKESLTERIRDYPIQGSMLVYPLNAAVAPYVLGGIGWYSQRVDTIAGGLTVSSTTTRKVGYHAGLGGEVRFRRRMAVHLDYRYTFIRIGESGNSMPGAIPIPGLLSVQQKLKLAHQGSMWTSGVTFFF